MDVETIEMSKTAARTALNDYRAALKARPNRTRDDAERELAAIDAAVMRGYRELARGNRLVKLSTTIAAGDYDLVPGGAERWESGRLRREQFEFALPKLAAIRADARSCWTRPRREGDGVTYQANGWTHWPLKANHLTVTGVIEWEDAYGSTCTDVPPAWACNNVAFKAMVPPVPPPLRPPHHLRNYVVLWEAEWSQGYSIPPGDPALLKHLGGDLYVLLAVWDLTDLERAVLTGVRA